jgi:transposase
MSAERLSMRMLREVLRLFLAAGVSQRAIARSLSVSTSTVNGYIGRARVAGLTWPLSPELDDDAALTRLLFPDERRPRSNRPEPAWARVHVELRKKHVTKQLLWEEYKSEQPDGYQYSQFCERYARFAATVNVVMRQEHRAGEKLFLDFSGDGIDIIDPDTGEVMLVAKLFVAVLGASNLTYAEPVASEDLPSWTGGHVRALEYMGGVTELWVPDNLKSDVTKPDRYRRRRPSGNPGSRAADSHRAGVVSAVPQARTQRAPPAGLEGGRRSGRLAGPQSDGVGGRVEDAAGRAVPGHLGALREVPWAARQSWRPGAGRTPPLGQGDARLPDAGGRAAVEPAGALG